MRVFDIRVLDKYLDRTRNGNRNHKGHSREVLKMIFGLSGYEKLSYKDISNKLKLSQSTVRKIKERAITKLREVPFDEFMIEEFNEDNRALDYSMFNYQEIATAPRECLICGLSVDTKKEKVDRRIHRDCSFERMTVEMAVYKKRIPRSLNYLSVWKKHHGDIPKGMHIHHIDGDHTNEDIDNLKLVTPQQHYEIHYNQGDYLAASLIKSKFLKKKQTFSNKT